MGPGPDIQSLHGSPSLCRAHRGGAALARGWERPAAAAVSSVRGCQHFQPRDNRALFPCHRGKRINIPRVCFQAALWNKSQTVVVSPGSPARGTACSHPVSHRRLAAPPRPRAAAGAAPCRLCRGHLEHNCSASTGSSAWHRRVSGSTSPPDTSAARTALATLSSGPVSGSGSIFEGKGLCCGTGESGEGSQGLFLFPLPRGEGNPRDAMASVLPPVGTCQQRPFRVVGSTPFTRCRKLGMMLTLTLEMWLHGEDVSTALPWLILMDTSYSSGRCVEREWSVECVWSQVNTTADAPVGSLGGGTQPVLDWHLLEQQILV